MLTTTSLRIASRTCHRYQRVNVSTFQVRCSSQPTLNSRFVKISDEVQEALRQRKPVVALETTIYTHGPLYPLRIIRKVLLTIILGWPYPENIGLASHLESVVRVHGGIPATIGLLDGVAHVGMSPEEIIQLLELVGKNNVKKVSRRDLGFTMGTVNTPH